MSSNGDSLNYENLSVTSLIFYEPGVWEFPQRKFMSFHLHNVEGDLAGEDPYGFALADSLAKMNERENSGSTLYEHILPKAPPRAAKLPFEDLNHTLSVNKLDSQVDEEVKRQPRDSSTRRVAEERNRKIRNIYGEERSSESRSDETNVESCVTISELDSDEKQGSDSFGCALYDTFIQREAQGLSPECCRMKEIFQHSVINIEHLKRLAWHGSPMLYRSTIWKILLGYWPIVNSRRSEVVKRKREDYRISLSRAFSQSHKSETEQERLIWRQITLDVPRICSDYNLFRLPSLQELLKRILFVWSVRHPACGYVQGMNDILMPLVYVLFSEVYQTKRSYSNPPFPMETENVSSVSIRCVERDEVLYLEDIDELSTALDDLEADIYWCFSSVLESIQDFYTFAQPGIQRRIQILEKLVGRVCPNLYVHFQRQGVELVQFAFRWLNCLLIRELPFPVVVRLWDSVLCEEDGFGSFYVFICASLLHFFERDLVGMEFQELILFLQNIPKDVWTDSNVKILLSQAYLWREMFNSLKSSLVDRI
ncbi:hypothetical protein GpartN1_g5849.t1 [Galdieria partita]|uniref:Rab-GAP TBC domain-containing protein n=1 Tax=Galdieria partita TaxID=83374 RepID=A0A9C7Q093_9RHOD|nr:hypothetical protein GpartN1_g5849.t1 [Galdieria partita]